MPASRKRNKGKERKAKQLVKKEENDRAGANRYWRSFCSTIAECNHGHPLVPDDHPVSSFMDQFVINLRHKGMTVGRTLREISKSHTNIWNNERYRKLAIGILAHIGTNMLVTFKDDEDYNTWLLCIAVSVMAAQMTSIQSLLMNG